MFFINPEKGWAAGVLNRISRTTNGGVNWINSIAFPASNEYNSIYFTDTLTGWTVGKNGIILKTTTGGVLTGFSNTSSEIPDRYFLSQNYPNPFNSSSNLGFGISKLGFVSLKVYDVLGNELAVIVNEPKNAGSYNYQFSSVNYQLPSGIYYYSLYVDGEMIDTKRMVLLK